MKDRILINKKKRIGSPFKADSMDKGVQQGEVHAGQAEALIGGWALGKHSQKN